MYYVAMIIQLEKFGLLLTSRQLGHEAFQAFRPRLEHRNVAEPLIVDFAGVTTFSPGWSDEFFTALLQSVGGQIHLRHTTNPSVQAILELLEQIHGPRFQRES